jgi:hypothetical protein
MDIDLEVGLHDECPDWLSSEHGQNHESASSLGDHMIAHYSVPARVLCSQA